MRRSNAPNDRQIRNSATWVTSLVLIVSFLMLLGATGYILMSDRQTFILQAKERADRSAGAVYEHASWIFQTSKQALLRIDSAIPDPKNRAGWLVNDLRPLSAGLPLEARVFIIDNKGFSIPIREDEVSVDLSTRDYFQNLKKSGNWYVGRQIVTKIRKDTVFTVAKRLVRDGKFAGVVGIAIPVDLMIRFYENLEIGKQSKIWLATLDGWVIASNPPVESDFNLLHLPEWQKIQASSPYSTGIEEFENEDIPYLISSKKLDNSPFIAIVALAKADIDATQYARQKKFIMAGSAGFIFLFLLGLWVVSLQRRDHRIRLELAETLLQKAESETNMRLALGAGQMGHWQIDPKESTILFSKHISNLLGIPGKETKMSIEEALNFICTEDRPRVSAEVKKSLEDGGPFNIEYQIINKDGRKYWLHSYGDSIFDKDGQLNTIVGVTLDATERRQFDERQRLMIAELDHRVKNTLASVQSLARQGLPKSDMTDAFIGRIGSLANAHSLLAESRWKGAAIRHLLNRQLAVHLANHQVTIDGPDLLLKPRTTQALCLVLHELTTNAIKYGALSSGDATLTVHWSVIKSPQGPRFILKWQENNVAHPLSATQHKGFGSRLIEQSIKHELNGNVELLVLPNGFSCTINIPLEEVQIVTNDPLIVIDESTQPVVEVGKILTGRNILLVEDTVFIAMDMEHLLIEQGANAVLSAFRLNDAIRKAKTADFDFALLDVNLDEEMVFPVAEILHQRNIPFIFLTGYGEETSWPEEWVNIPRLTKPVQDKALFKAISQLDLHHRQLDLAVSL